MIYNYLYVIQYITTHSKKGDIQKATMENKKHFDKIRKGFGALSFAYDRTIALGGLAEESTIRKESIESLNLRKGDTVFDICCGTGLNFKLLEKNIGNDGRIVGLDLTPELLNIAASRCDKMDWNNITLVSANLLEFNTDVLADCAVSTASIGMIPEYSQAIDRVMKYLKPEGRFVIVDGKTSAQFPNRAFNHLYYLAAKSAGFDFINRDLVGYIQSKYEIVFYKEYLGGFCYAIAFKRK